MTSILAALAPAKLNFGLRIVGRRDDGYHLLESLFVPIALADRLTLFVEEREQDQALGTPQIQLEVLRDPSLPADSPLPEAAENLATRAARRFYEASGRAAPRLSIRLEKAIPVGAGLGGGSSDAGAVLRVLAAHHPGWLSSQELLELATRLGADVPFFLAPGPSWVRGIGEQIEPIEGFPGHWLVLANPGQSLATAKVFAGFDGDPGALTLARSRPTMRSLEAPGMDANAAESFAKAFDSGLLTNDLEPAATRLCPAIEELQRRLREVGASWVGMSGSGATVYGIFADEQSARRALERVAFEPPVWACVTQTKAGTAAWRGEA